MSITFLEKRKTAYIVSGILIISSLASLSINGLNQGVDFVGGRSYTVRFDKIVNPTEIESVLVVLLEVLRQKLLEKIIS